MFYAFSSITNIVRAASRNDLYRNLKFQVFDYQSKKNRIKNKLFEIVSFSECLTI